jgi:P-type E1-E2 ATPase
MIDILLPNRDPISLQHLVLDVNGTLARDGRLLDGVARSLNALRDRLTLHLLTANTHGRQDQIDHLLGLKATRLSPGNESAQKADYVRGLGAEHVVAVGNGANDAAMLRAAAIGIAVLGEEGLAVAALTSASLVAANISDALNLLEFPARLVATLRA